MKTHQTRHHHQRSWGFAWLHRHWAPTAPTPTADRRARLPGQTAPAIATWSAPR